MASARINHLDATRKRLHNRFASKYLKKASPANVVSASSNVASALGRVDVASTIFAEEMRPDYLEEARYRLRSNYQAFIDTFDHGRHGTPFFTTDQPTLGALLNQNTRDDTSENGTNYFEAARLRLRNRFHAKFMKEFASIQTNDVFDHFPATTDQIPETMASSWAQEAAIVITEARSPFNILHVNQAWVGLCGYTKDEAVGQTFTTLGINAKGVTERDLTKDMMKQLALGKRTSVKLTNLNKSGKQFVNHLRIAPVLDQYSGEVVKYFGLLEDLSSAVKLEDAA